MHEQGLERRFQLSIQKDPIAYNRLFLATRLYFTLESVCDLGHVVEVDSDGLLLDEFSALNTQLEVLVAPAFF